MPPSSPDGMSGEPQALPRLGDQYQAEIPSLLAEEQSQLRNSLVYSCQMFDDGYSSGTGLPIPIMWVQQSHNEIRYHKQTYPTTTVIADKLVYTDMEGQIGNACNNVSSHPCVKQHGAMLLGCKVELSDEAQECESEFTMSTSQNAALNHNKEAVLPVLQLEQKESNNYFPLPISAAASWSDAESNSFLLGLYIFGKNLNKVRNFVGVKQMGDVLSFYYGKFYRSEPYKRWAECIKMTTRRCIHGQRIFTGRRQQELLSRLLPDMPPEAQDNLWETTRNFSEGKVSLEDYVFTLKVSVGLEKLVDAVAIGKGKYDITGIVSDPVRTNFTFPIRSEIPIGKACSSLTSEDIVKYLTGDFRLSKARSNDLFWEAVWPRLLAKGWHSEQPLDLASVGSKSTLVFLVPGVKKFSRKRLVKGNHYFDSVSDVLNKVASDPKLLDLESEGMKGNISIKEESDAQIKLNQARSNHQRHAYLRPKVPTFSAELTKFTVVDTSLYHGETPLKVRDVRMLPADAISSPIPIYEPMEKSDSDSSEDESHSSDVPAQIKMEPQPSPSINSKVTTGEETNLSNTPAAFLEQTFPAVGYDSDDQWELRGKHMIDEREGPSIKGSKPLRPTYLSPAPKRRRLTACKQAARQKFSTFGGYKLENEELDYKTSLPKPSQDSFVEAGPSLEVTTPLGMLNPDVSRNYCLADASIGKEVEEEEKPQSLSFDLNMPQFPTDFDSSASIFMDPAGNQNGWNLKGSSSSSGILHRCDDRMPNGAVASQQSTTGSLRQSTRNRPLTTKALEAFECGFLNAGWKVGKGIHPYALPNLHVRPSRQARRSARAPTPSSANIGILNTDNAVPSVAIGQEFHGCMNHNSHASMHTDCQLPNESKETQELLGVP